MDIDLVVPYVNCNDRHWVRDFAEYTGIRIPNPSRYRSWGTLKYLFRGVSEYLPFVRQIVLLVAKPSQVPSWVNTETVRVVYHKEFIPKEFLPTFNSCTIESYLWKIPDLAEKIIYINDDMFPTGLMEETDFFTDNTPHISFTKPYEYSPKTMYQAQCRSGIDLITKALDLPSFEKGKITRPQHISTAFIRDNMLKVGELCEEAIAPTTSRMRLTKNVNQYIYAYYQYFTNDYINETISYKYFELTEKNWDTIKEAILSSTYQMICLNDTSAKDYEKVKILLHKCFEQKFISRCKYEL